MIFLYFHLKSTMQKAITPPIITSNDNVAIPEGSILFNVSKSARSSLRIDTIPPPPWLSLEHYGTPLL
ncbi:hypothetical protein BN133_4013 [Cronobacter dublinensis 582]|nr:hypothetical protein BN133_4013 [Cronobacter dublinensis 582]